MKYYSIGLIVAEVVSKVKRSGGDFELSCRVLMANSKTIEFNNKMFKEAGILHADAKKAGNFGLADAMVLVAARKIGAKILTSDYHFKNLKESVYFLL